MDGADAIVYSHAMRNVALHRDGRLPMVCPSTDTSEFRGLGIFDCSVDETTQLTDADPAVMAGVLHYEVHSVRSFPGSTLPGSASGIATPGVTSNLGPSALPRQLPHYPDQCSNHAPADRGDRSEYQKRFEPQVDSRQHAGDRGCARLVCDAANEEDGSDDEPDPEPQLEQIAETGPIGTGRSRRSTARRDVTTRRSSAGCTGPDSAPRRAVYGCRRIADLVRKAFEALHHSKSVRRPRVDVPGLWLFGGELDQPQGGVAELPRTRDQPRNELLRIDDGDPTLVGRSPVEDRLRVKDCKHRRNSDRKAQSGRQSPRNVAAVAHRLPQMMRVRIIDTKHGVADPDGRIRMVLGVDCKDSPRPDDQVIHVFRTGSDGYRVPHEPARPELFEHLPDFDLTEGTDIPRPRIIVQPHAVSRLQRRVAGLGLRLHLKTLGRHGVAGSTRRQRLDARKVDVRASVIARSHRHPRTRR